VIVRKSNESAESFGDLCLAAFVGILLGGSGKLTTVVRLTVRLH